MNREAMVEAGVRGLADYWKYDWDDLSEDSRSSYGKWVRAVLDAVLPQITSWEQLQALPDGSVIMGLIEGSTLPEFFQWHYGDLYALGGDEDFGVVSDWESVTVVYKPRA